MASHDISCFTACDVEDHFFPPQPSSNLSPISDKAHNNDQKKKLTEAASANSFDDDAGNMKDKTDKKVVEKAVRIRRDWPPPIPCLRNVKRGTPYSHVSFDEITNKYVVETVNIPKGSFLRAHRQDGTLRLSMNNLFFSDEEDDEDQY